LEKDYIAAKMKIRSEITKKFRDLPNQLFNEPKESCKNNNFNQAKISAKNDFLNENRNSTNQMSTIDYQ